MNQSYFPLSDDIFLLNSYQNQCYDGLRQVFQRVLGNSAPSETYLPKHQVKILVCNMPTVHIHELSAKNINICYTTFETTELPESWIKALNTYYDHCVVPHECIKNCFENSGVRIPISVIPQGFARHQRSLVPPQEVFRVGFLGVPQKRKNVEPLFKACQQLRRQIPKLKLAVHAATLYAEIAIERLKPIKNCSWVEWTEGVLDEHKIADWYSQLSCYAYPSSGEGWSFTPRESLYMGIPTIISDIPVHKELLESGFCKPIPSKGLIPALHETINGYQGQTVFGNWGCFEEDDIAKAIAEVYYHYEYYFAKAIEGKKWISQQWKNHQVSSDLLSLIKNLHKV